MNMFLIIGLIVILIGVLVYSRRKRAAEARTETALAVAPAAPTPAPAPQAPLPRPAAVHSGVASAPVHSPPPPSNWIPEETIVEPGWPLPGEISGAWSPVTTDTGAAAAIREPAPAATAVVEMPEPAPIPEAPPFVESADEWLMPETPAVAWTPPVDMAPPAAVEPAPEQEWQPEPAPAEEAFAVEAAATVWAPPAADPEVESGPPLWTPPADEVSWPVDEVVTEAPEPAAEIPAPAPDPAPTPDPVSEQPVVWNLEAPSEPEREPEPEPEPEAVPAPPVAEWIEPVAEEIPAPAPEPLFIPEPAVAPEPADLRDQSVAVAGLSPLLEGLRPLTRVSDRTGVTPRLLVLMRLLADGPLSVTEQAQRLEVSRPVVADLSARLESMGLAQRERDAGDRRRVRIALTDRGRRVCDEAPPAPDPAAIEAALARMDAGERDGLILGLRALERLAATR